LLDHDQLPPHSISQPILIDIHQRRLWIGLLVKLYLKEQPACPAWLPELAACSRPCRSSSQAASSATGRSPPARAQAERIRYRWSTELCLASSKILTPHPSPPGECVLPPRQRREVLVHTRRAERGVGRSIFWKTQDIGLASYSTLRAQAFHHHHIITTY
jgi:hypothetical protein